MRYILLALSLCGCGVSVPPLKPQEIVSNLTKPAWSVAQNGFSLLGHRDQLNMKGSLLIWDEQISAANLERLSRVSSAKKQQSVNYEQVSQYVATERQRLQDALPLIAAQQQKVRELFNAAHARARAENSAEWQRHQQEQWNKGAAWLATQMTELIALDPNWQRSHTEQVLRSYCEGKIFALAVSENLLRRKYTQRPTAHIMCESYYHQLFADKPACQATDDAQGKDYFQCIWLHGVLATAYFRENYAAVEAQQAKITALQQVLSAEPQSFKQRILNAYDNPAQRRYLKFYQRLGRIGFGDRAVTVRPRKGQAFILQLVRDVESPAQREDVASLAPERRIFRNPASSGEIAAHRNILITGLQALAKTVAGVSVSDYRFNRDIAVPRLPAAEEGNCVNTGILSKAMEFLCNLRRAEALLPQLLRVVQLPLPEIDQHLIAVAQRLLADLQQRHDSAIDALEKRDLDAFDLYSEALDTAVNTARAPSIAQALFAGVQLRIVANEEQYVISFKLLEREGVWFTACRDRNSGEETSCVALGEDQVQDSDVFSAAYTEEEGRLDLHFNLQQPERVGFELLNRDSDNREQDRASFCDLAREKFEALQLKMELYANIFAEKLEIITGNGKFENAAGETVYQASVGFERELDI